MGNGTAAFRPASNLKTAWGISPAVVFKVTETHEPPHLDKVAATGRVFSFLFSKSSLGPRFPLCGTWFWCPLYQFLVCSLLSSSYSSDKSGDCEFVQLVPQHSPQMSLQTTSSISGGAAG
ncbi:hypothetical protein NL108_017539 [Boleophthalmus pectinirostris]|nr:hypothetical protein NL108_017539 [Boleophthalmus pectinirostris]